MREEGEVDVRLWVGLAGHRTMGEKNDPSNVIGESTKTACFFLVRLLDT